MNETRTTSIRESRFDELDVAIVDAVRSAPRVSWRELAPVLGVDAATISRRWSRMQSAGVAWVTAHLGGSATPACALVELVCLPGRSGPVADAIAQDVQAATVKLTSGARDVVVLAQAPTLHALTEYLLGRFSNVVGITAVRAQIATRSTVEASRWREGALDPEQRRQLVDRCEKRTDHDPGNHVLDDTDQRLVRELTSDGRMSFEQLADHVGIGPVAARRRLAKLRASGSIVFRCDTSQELSGRTVAAVYFGNIDVQSLEEAESRIRTIRGVRSCSIVAGPYNIVIDAWLRSVGEVHDLERKMSHALPALRVQDRSVVLRTVKLLGRVLDVRGRSVQSIPLLPDSA